MSQGSCPADCKCMAGGAGNGGAEVNAQGFCEKYCSPEYSGTRYCGTGSDYKKGDFVDCTGCAQANAGTTTNPFIAPESTANPFNEAVSITLTVTGVTVVNMQGICDAVATELNGECGSVNLDQIGRRNLQFGQLFGTQDVKMTINVGNAPAAANAANAAGFINLLSLPAGVAATNINAEALQVAKYLMGTDALGGMGIDFVDPNKEKSHKGRSISFDIGKYELNWYKDENEEENRKLEEDNPRELTANVNPFSQSNVNQSNVNPFTQGDNQGTDSSDDDDFVAVDRNDELLLDHNELGDIQVLYEEKDDVKFDEKARSVTFKIGSYDVNYVLGEKEASRRRLKEENTGPGDVDN